MSSAGPAARPDSWASARSPGSPPPAPSGSWRRTSGGATWSWRRTSRTPWTAPAPARSPSAPSPSPRLPPTSPACWSRKSSWGSVTARPGSPSSRSTTANSPRRAPAPPWTAGLTQRQRPTALWTAGAGPDSRQRRRRATRWPRPSPARCRRRTSCCRWPRRQHCTPARSARKTGWPPLPRASRRSGPAPWRSWCWPATSWPPSPTGVNAAEVLRELSARYRECWTYGVDGLVGATPEMLIQVEGRTAQARVLAGTLDRRDADGMAGSPLEFAERVLAGSEKQRHEHDIAIQSLTTQLAPFSEAMNAHSEPFILELPNVWHLASDVKAELAEVEGHVPTCLALINALHPTAAVCGTPTTVAGRPDPQARAPGPRPVRRAGRLARRRRQRRMGHRAARRRHRIPADGPAVRGLRRRGRLGARDRARRDVGEVPSDAGVARHQQLACERRRGRRDLTARSRNPGFQTDRALEILHFGSGLVIQ